MFTVKKGVFSAVALTLAASFGGASAVAGDKAASTEAALNAALTGSHRGAAAKARDQYRNPAETLGFFWVTPGMKVVEIWPGGGWYTEVLAPYLREQGQFHAAHFPVNTDVNYFKRVRNNFKTKMAETPAVYDRVQLTEFHPPSAVKAGPDGEADRVLTFRNVHNWMKAGFAEQAFAEFSSMLKPGGILGVVEHRAKPGTDMETMIKSGYVTGEHVIALAEGDGFELEAKSEINANAADSADHPGGVWTLPPSLRYKEKDKEKYMAIGESDRMTLKFIRPI